MIDAEWVQVNLARVHAKTEVLKLLNWRVASEIDAGKALGPAAASATKVYGTELTIEACRLLIGRLKPVPRREGQIHSRPFVGRIDELALYNRPLTAEEVRLHFELGAP